MYFSMETLPLLCNRIFCMSRYEGHQDWFTPRNIDLSACQRQFFLGTNVISDTRGSSYSIQIYNIGIIVGTASGYITYTDLDNVPDL